MNKEEFLSILRKNLSVLEESEINDIVEEYEQHIDMKMKGGLSEKEAICDFGDMKELTAGILEAYHVKADFSRGEKKNVDFSKVVEESKKATNAIGKGTTDAGKWIGKQCKKIWSFIKKPFVLLKEEINAANEKRVKNKEKKTENMGQKDEGKKGFLGRLWNAFLTTMGMIWAFFMGVINWAWRGIKWCFKTLIKVFWAAVIAFAGLGALGGIFVIGAVFVLLMDNYPLTGVLIFTIGMLAINLSCILLGIIFLKKKSYYKLLLGMLAGGVLLTGIGFGVAFGEYSAFEYGGEVMLPGSKHITKTVNYTIESDDKTNAESAEANSEDNVEPATDEKTYTVLMDSWYYTIIEDESIPRDEIRFKVKYITDKDNVSPHITQDDKENLICFSTGFEYNELREFMRFKDVLLSDIKQQKISDYQFDGTDIVEIHINPETSIEVEN